MDSTGFSINAISGVSSSPDATEIKISKALAELTTCFQEGADYKSFLRQLRKYALLKTGIAIPDLSSCSCCLLDSCDSLCLLPSAWLPPHMRAFSSAPFSSCMRTITDITAVADVFCGGDIPSAQILLATDPSRWPLADCYDVMALALSPGSATTTRTSLYRPPPRVDFGTSPLSFGAYAQCSAGSFPVTNAHYALAHRRCSPGFYPCGECAA